MLGRWLALVFAVVPVTVGLWYYMAAERNHTETSVTAALNSKLIEHVGGFGPLSPYPSVDSGDTIPLFW